VANINVCVEIELLKVKVPLICLGTEVSRYVGRDVTSFSVGTWSVLVIIA
jgi:hypothetical protein